MLPTLFNSATRVAIFALLFEQPQRKRYIQEIIKQTGSDAANVHRELRKLEKLGLLISERVGNQKYFGFNARHLHYRGLQTLFDEARRHRRDDRWFVMEKMPSYPPQGVVSAWNAHGANTFFEMYGLPCRFSRMANIFDHGYTSLAAPKAEFDAASEVIVKAILDDPGLAERYMRDIRNHAAGLFATSRQLVKKNLKTLTNRQLGALYDQTYLRTYVPTHRLNWIQTCTDLGTGLFSRALMDVLQEHVPHHERSVGDVFATLTTPTEESFAMKEHGALLTLLEFIVARPSLRTYIAQTETRIVDEELLRRSPALHRRINAHAQAFGWLGHGLAGPGWGRHYFLDILASLVRQGARPAKIRKENAARLRHLKTEQATLVRELGLRPYLVRIFAIARDLVATKALRKDSMFCFYSAIANFYKEVSRRLYLTIDQVYYLAPHELQEVLRTGKVDIAEINARRKLFVHLSTGKGWEHDEYFIGEQAQQFLERTTFVDDFSDDLRLLQGECASPGRVRGATCIVNTPADMKKMKKGNVLVSTATTPDLMPAIKQAAAIITDVGGITCHAAIVSRELGTPCVIGTKFATRVLLDGTIVDVDATHGKVTVIKKA